MKIKKIIISLIHIFLFGSLLLFIGWKENKTPQWAFWLTLFLGMFVLIDWVLLSKQSFMSIIHLIFVFPLLTALGILQTKSPNYLYKSSIIIGSATIGYHIISIIKNFL